MCPHVTSRGGSRCPASKTAWLRRAIPRDRPLRIEAARLRCRVLRWKRPSAAALYTHGRLTPNLCAPSDGFSSTDLIASSSTSMSGPARVRARPRARHRSLGDRRRGLEPSVAEGGLSLAPDVGLWPVRGSSRPLHAVGEQRALAAAELTADAVFVADAGRGQVAAQLAL